MPTIEHRLNLVEAAVSELLAANGREHVLHRIVHELKAIRLRLDAIDAILAGTDAAEIEKLRKELAEHRTALTAALAAAGDETPPAKG